MLIGHPKFLLLIIDIPGITKYIYLSLFIYQLFLGVWLKLVKKKKNISY